MRNLAIQRAGHPPLAPVTAGNPGGFYTVEIQLTQGFVAIIDAENAHLTVGRKWVVSRSNSHWYAVRGKGKTREYLHRLVAGAEKGQRVDHVNGDTLDNRAANLRLCTQQQNAWNQRGRGLYAKGVTRRNGRFYARITVSYKNLYLGSFASEAEAASAYDAAARKYYGEFARPNCA